MIKKVPFYGFFLALALILAFIESLIPIPFGVPGMKLGLSNLMVVILIYIWSPKEALLLNLCRILLSGFMFGNAFAILYSLGGAALSFLAMWLVFRSGRYTIATMSILGGLFHNIGQLAVAKAALSGISLFWYAPPLMVCGSITGCLIGLLATELLPRLPRFIKVEL